MRLKVVSVIVMVLFLAGMLSIWVQPVAAAPAGWDYRRTITLSPATPVPDYQIKIELNTSNFDYSKADPDGDDIRFYNISDNKLSYWIETWNNTGTSFIWVKVPTSGTDTIYMYYDNPSATSESNGDDVFDFFDDFNDGVYTDKWTNPHPQGTYTESGGLMELYSTGYCSLDSIKNFTGPVIIESRSRRFDPGNDGLYATSLREVDKNNFVSSEVGSYYGQWFGIRRYGTDFGSEMVSFLDSASNEWKEFKGFLYNYTWHVYRGDVLGDWDRNDSLPLEASADGREYYVQIFTHEWGDTGAYWDWIRVRKYTSIEPSATVGEETTELTLTSSPMTGITFTINGTSQTTSYVEWLTEGYYILEMPATHNGYVWSQWLEDGDPNRIKTILLQGTTWTAVYEPAPPVGGKAIPINQVTIKPMDNLELLAPYIGLTILLAVTTVTVVYVKKRKRDTEISS